MAKTKGSITTTVKIRMPHEVLSALDAWAAINKIPRSVAVRRLMLRSMTEWHDDPDGYCAVCEGGTGRCYCETEVAAQAA